ncbi:hypothetical protein QAD02_001653 [Eretmocerus hayati]|uniref:Uncharacterized protein n=1 Tax=Eretmocerus hayati TaxID=131215 RepID=A0ACC2NH08_9HYME|nr:hypothetical protein QAD02_001653 [Eretmocerus hayati]
MRADGCGSAKLLFVAGAVFCCWCNFVKADRGEAELVSHWADDIGRELSELASAVTNAEEILDNYRDQDVRVQPKSGREIIKTISENVGRMLSRKMDAVKCLYKEAEKISEYWENDFSNFTYYSAKYSNVTIENVEEYSDVPKNMQLLGANNTYDHMYLEPDTHFNNVSVNTTFSSVHIPTNVYDRLQRVEDTIRWSKRMDRIFKHNYRSDPALMWQYFCSTTGMLRMFPAMRWPFGVKKDESALTDTYDCRVRTWYIEATTCSKDMVILVDNSGSMTGMSNSIAKTTVASILSTLSNNDFVAVFSFSDTTQQLVSCFQDKLVQVTPENVKKFNAEMAKLRPEGVANLTEAFITAFDLLDDYRNETRCGKEMHCNQLIMLITDGVASNATEVFRDYNWFENNTVAVRVFTYLIGLEVSGVREIQWMACLNRGFYAHVHTQAEVQEQVLKYIPVVARPLVLQNTTHPVVWTHAYTDISDELAMHASGKSKRREEKWGDRLLTSVSIPVFDRKGNRKSDKRVANLLGVVGTDVPLKDIRKLTLPYKLGVNGYAFIVSNNGYVVLHPALKPEFEGELKLNYDSIDLTEVEILDDGRGPRDPGDEITEIRRALVNHECDSKKDVKVKLHYDDYRRVNLESRDYYYAPLPLTPFGIAVVLPKYGRFYIKVGKEIEKDRHRNISDLFVGENWSIHPEWVYCRYHYLEGHEFDTPEDEMRHFLKIVGNFSKSEAERFPEQYKSYDEAHIFSKGQEAPKMGKCGMNEPDPMKEDPYEMDCGSENLNEELEDYEEHRNDHYCNKELMELLIMDAIATNASFSGDYKPRDERDIEQIRRFNVFLRFVATQSGLTRWQRVEGVDFDGVEDKVKEFERHRRALDEAWYKGAILQHAADNESISITVPPIKEPESGHDAVVTFSHGIFPLDNSKDAAAAVVGFQLPMQTLHEQFSRLLTQNRPVAGLNCSNPSVDCYLIDQNGYIIISDANHNDTGKFFGALDQTAPIMRQLVDQGLFRSVDIYDYLAVCRDYTLESAASMLKTPFVYVWNFITWFSARLLLFTSQIHDLPMIFAQEETDDEDFKKPPEKRKMRYSRPCDMKMTLYIVNSKAETFDKVYTNKPDDCALPFYARRVRYTNLMLVIVKTDRNSCYDKLDVSPYEIFPYTIGDNATEWPCHKIQLNTLYRRRLEHCVTRHDDEYEIDSCGGASALKVSLSLVLIVTVKGILKFL